tara:strand:- start:710 stop:838 length:129 start_codon:yes stop_codon:yes gene_type:complete
MLLIGNHGFIIPMVPMMVKMPLDGMNRYIENGTPTHTVTYRG